MHNVSARDAKNKFGQILETSQHEDVLIERHGRPFSVIMSVRRYRQIQGVAAGSNKMSGDRLLEFLGAGNKFEFDTDDKISPEARIRILRDEWA